MRISSARAIRNIPKSGVLILILLAFSPRGVPQARVDGDFLDNDAIVKMVKDGLGEKLLIQMVQSRPGRYVLTPASLGVLKKQGVPDTVLSAMLAKEQKPPSSEGSVERTVTTGRPRAGSWKIDETADRMSGARELQATRSDRAIGKRDEGEFEVTATCNPEALVFNIVFLADSDPKLGFKQNVEGNTIIPGGLIGALAAASRHQKPWVEMRVRINNGAPKSVSSENDYSNEATVFFSGRSVERAMSDINSQPGGRGYSDKRVDEGVLNFVRLYAAAKAAGTAQQAANAESILIELPLANGDSPILEIKPQDPSFQQFVGKCGAALPPESASSTAARSGTMPAQSVNSPASRLRKAPGHSINDSYSRTLALVQQNSNNAIRDDVAPLVGSLTPLDVCYSLSHRAGDPPQVSRECNKTGESVRVPGDLLVAPEFWTSYPRMCRALGMQGKGLEVNLKEPVQANNRKRFIHCTTAFLLGARRQQLLSAGVAKEPVAEPEGVPASQPIGLATIPNPAKGTLPETRDLYARDLNLKILPDRAAPGVRTIAELLAALDNSLWIADGNRSERQVYVIAGPCCGYSQALYRNTRQFGGMVQFRWIITAPTVDAKCQGYAGEAAASKDASALVHMYETLAPPVPVPLSLLDNAIRWNTGVENATAAAIQSLDDQRRTGVFYPTLVWLAKDGVHVAVRPTRIQQIVESVVARPGATHVLGRAREFLSTVYQLQPVPATLYLAKTDAVKGYSLPDTRSQLVYTLPKDQGYRARRRVTVNGETWIEMAWGEAWRPGFFVRETEVYPGE